MAFLDILGLFLTIISLIFFTGLEAGSDYHIVVYASNDLGLSPKVSFNASTLNLAEKRTAETRSKLSPIMNDPKKLDVTQDTIQVSMPIGCMVCQSATPC